MKPSISFRILCSAYDARSLRTLLVKEFPMLEAPPQTSPLRADEASSVSTLHSPEGLVAITGTLIAGGALYSALKGIIPEILHRNAASIEYFNLRTGKHIRISGKSKHVEQLLRQVLDEGSSTTPIEE